MIKKVLILVTMLSLTHSFSQVGIGTTNPDSSAMLEIQSTSSGLLIPRMTEAERLAIASPATGLMVYETDTAPGFWYYDGSVWTTFGADADWTVSGTDMYNANTGNVGIGNTAPTALLHLTGTTVPASSGTSTLYANDFSSGGVTYVANAGNGCTSSPSIWHVSTTSSNASCTTCTGNRAYISYSSSCVQDQTLIEGTFTPTTTSVNISFNYGYDDYSGSTDRFTATLYNETTSSVTATLFDLTTDALNSSYSGTHTVIAGNDYSLRFQYIGDNAWGASTDDILVTETTTPTPGTYIFRLEDGQEQDGYVLTSDASGNATWKALGGGSGGAYTFTNGLTESSATVKLGGSLIEDTTIGANSFALNVSSSAKTNMLYVDNDEDVVKFGHNTTPWDDGSTYTIDSNSTTIEYITSNYNGTSRGTTTGVGSLEYFVDVEASIACSDNFLPISDNSLSLGTSNNRWIDLYLVNAATVSSDMTLKNNVKNLSYGLDKLMQLETYSYQWKKDHLRDTKIPNHQKETHLGFSAQQLLEVMPEVVETHSWKILDEKTPNKYTRVKNDKLGVRYSEIIPVTVKAIQEQQEQIKEQKEELNNLKTLVKELQEQNELLAEKIELFSKQ